MQPTMIGVKAAATIYGIGRNRIYDAIQTGELRAYRPNSRAYVLKTSDIESWIMQYQYSPIAGRREI